MRTAKELLFRSSHRRRQTDEDCDVTNVGTVGGYGRAIESRCYFQLPLRTCFDFEAEGECLYATRVDASTEARIKTGSLKEASQFSLARLFMPLPVTPEESVERWSQRGELRVPYSALSADVASSKIM